MTIPAAMAPLLLQFPDLDRRVWVLAVARLIVTAGFSAVMPFLAMHLAVERGVPLMRIGALWTVVGLSGAAMQWVAGRVADRIGRRRVLITAMVVRSANLAMMGYAINAEASFLVIGALCVVNGASRAFYDPIASALVAQLSSAEERVAAFSLHRVGSSLGWAAGPLLATLASDVPFGILFYIGAPITLIAAFPVAGVTERHTTPLAKPRSKEDAFSILGRDRAFVRFLAATFAFYLLQTQMYHIMAIYAAKHVGLDRAQVGTLFMLNGILVVLLQLPAVRYIRQVGTKNALVVGSIGYVIAYAGCGLASGYASLLACVALVTLSEIIALPAQQTTVTSHAPVDKVAGYAGIFGFVQGAAQTAGPVLGSALLDTTSTQTTWFLLASIGVVAAFGYARKTESSSRAGVSGQKNG